MSVLEEMTAGITRNAPPAPRRSLTPVAGEEPTTVASAAAAIVAAKAEVAAGIPGDVPGVIMARERLVDMAKELRAQAAVLLSVADGLDVITGVPEAVERDSKKTAETKQHLAEQEADRKAADRAKAEGGDAKAAKRVTEFEAHLAALQAAAQAATYAAADAGTEAEEPAGEWNCPTHGAEFTKGIESRSGRKYRACRKCEEFEH